MFSPSLDHLPFMLGGADVSFTFEQQIPLSGIRGHRRASALADIDRLRAEANRATLDVGTGGHRLPDAAGASADGSARRRAARVRATSSARRMRDTPAEPRRSPTCFAPRSRSPGSRRLPARCGTSARRRSHGQHGPCARSGRATSARIPHIRTAPSTLVGHQGGPDVPTGTVLDAPRSSALRRTWR